MESAGPRWKGRGYADIAQANPMAGIVKQLQTALKNTAPTALLSSGGGGGGAVLLEAGPGLSDLLNRTCFGRPIVTSARREEHQQQQWFQLGPEEAFYLCHDLKCLRIADGDDDGESCSHKDGEELWEHLRSKREGFPNLYRAYSHLRKKNWVVRCGTQYGVDFVAYRHHPALVHSEFGVFVLEEEEGRRHRHCHGRMSGGNPRLRVWSDLHCASRVCGSVAKSLLVLSVKTNGSGDDDGESAKIISKELRRRRTSDLEVDAAATSRG